MGYPGDSCIGSPPYRGETVVITSLDGGTSVSLRPEDSKAPLLELWAWRLEQEEHVDSQAFVDRNSSFEAQKSPFCCLASNIHDR